MIPYSQANVVTAYQETGMAMVIGRFNSKAADGNGRKYECGCLLEVLARWQNLTRPFSKALRLTQNQICGMMDGFDDAITPAENSVRMATNDSRVDLDHWEEYLEGITFGKASIESLVRNRIPIAFPNYAILVVDRGRFQGCEILHEVRSLFDTSHGDGSQ